MFSWPKKKTFNLFLKKNKNYSLVMNLVILTLTQNSGLGKFLFSVVFFALFLFTHTKKT